MTTIMENVGKKIAKNIKRQFKTGSECELIVDQIKMKYPFLIESFLEGEDFSIADMKVEFVIPKNSPVGSSDHFFARLIYKQANVRKFKNSMWWDQDYILYNKLPII
jgi:phosphoribosylaminoimidazole-succinocarboxamide synthase